MSAKVEEQVFRFDALKWIVVVALVGAGVFANSYYSEMSLFIRVPALIVAGLVALAIAAFTAKGSATVNLLRESVVEVRKVVWPTNQETNQTTLIVLAAVVISALILWGIDSLLGWIASLILG